jgi:hypothetical protein
MERFVVVRGPFEPIGPLGDLDDDLAAWRIHLGMSLTVGSAGRGGAFFSLVDANHLDRRVGGGREHVPVVKKCVLRITDVDKRGLQTGVEVLDACP